MKKKVLVLALLCFMGITVFSVGNAGATLYTCTVVTAGCDTVGNVILTLTEQASLFTGVVFYTTNASNKNQILAAALTAVSTGGHLVADLSGTTAYSIVMAAMATP